MKIERGEPLTELQEERWEQGEPDCGECINPLLPGNQDAWRVYQATRTQLIVAMGGAVSINQLAVWKWIDRYSIQQATRVFEQVCQVAQEIINDRNETAQSEAT